jgi:DNA-binding CsgD family transcriptional regulator
MDDYHGLTSLIEDIYDAALDAARWSDILPKVADFVGGRAALLSQDAVSGYGGALYHAGIDPHHLQLYTRTYRELDPAMLSIFGEGQIASISGIVRGDEFREGLFYREWMRPQGWIDAATAVLERTATRCTKLSIIRSEAQGIVDEEMRQRMQLVTTHMRRAVIVGNVSDPGRADAAMFADILDGFTAGVIVVDATARIVHTNTAGRGILHDGDVLSTAGGRLVASDVQVNQILREAFAGGEAAERGSKSIAVPLMARNGARKVAHVLPLSPGARRHAGVALAAAAAVFVRNAMLEMPSTPEIIADIYRLTRTELRVLLAIVSVGGVPRVAQALGIAESTVKTHLGNLFEKTGATCQADLVKLVAGFSYPFIG